MPEEVTQLRTGAIVRTKYPQLDAEDQEAIRQRVIAAMNVVQGAKKAMREAGEEGSTAFIDGVRRFAMDVCELDIDLIDRINPFGEAYAILARGMDQATLARVAAAIAGKRSAIGIEEARDLARRAVRFKQERGRVPLATSADAWERHMAEGIAVLARLKAEAACG